MNQQHTNQAIEYVTTHQDELVDLIKQLCVIPSPSHHEQQRASFINNWLHTHGCEGSYIDDVSNVIYTYPSVLQQGEKAIVFMAHIDTVFPDTAPFTVMQNGNTLACPGIGDDTTNVAVLMLMARYFAKSKLPVKHKLLFVFDAGEEGLGNLKGCRHFFDTHPDRVIEMIALDGSYDGICHQSVGSLRYQVEVKTEGGHSYANFGNRNAIVCLSQLIDDLYSIKVPAGTTYNVGEIHGGTSVNTIAQQASMLFEIRSVDRDEMEHLRQYFEKTIVAHRLKDIEIEVTLLGERPCMGDVDQAKQNILLDRIASIIEHVSGQKPKRYAGSTDCNIPFSRGVNAACFGAYIGKGAHTKEESIELDSLLSGCKIVATLMMEYVE